VVSSAMEGKTVFGMMNIGYNPTVEGKEKSIEINFFDFDGDLYGKRIQIDVMERIRDEQKFSSIEALKAQLKKDRETSLSIISK
jgi:riboflavin kinase/FMN adenylyltransferase